MKCVPRFVAAITAAVGLAGNCGASTTLHPSATEAIATGNEWVALPEIRAADAALLSFNVLSWRDRGLLEEIGRAHV